MASLCSASRNARSSLSRVSFKSLPPLPQVLPTGQHTPIITIFSSGHRCNARMISRRSSRGTPPSILMLFNFVIRGAKEEMKWRRRSLLKASLCGSPRPLYIASTLKSTRVRPRLEIVSSTRLAIDEGSALLLELKKASIGHARHWRLRCASRNSRPDKSRCDEKLSPPLSSPSSSTTLLGV